MGAWRRFKRNRAAMAGLAFILFLVLMAVVGPLLTPYNPDKQNLTAAMQPISASHLLGTDGLGRDVLSRLVYGTRISLLVSVAAVLLGAVVGTPLGIVAGYLGGWVDLGLSRLTDVLLAFNVVVLSLAFVARLGIGERNVIIAVGISIVPIFVRLARGSVLSLREQNFVKASRLLGARNRRVIRQHLLPNSLAPIVVGATLSVATAVVAAAGLGYLGLGVQPPAAEWGSMLGDAQQYIFSNPFLLVPPGLALFLAVMAFNVVGDGLRDALDPQQEQHV